MIDSGRFSGTGLWFFSVTVQGRAIGGIQIDAETLRLARARATLITAEAGQAKSANYRAFAIDTVDHRLPISEFVPAERLESLGYSKAGTGFA